MSDFFEGGSGFPTVSWKNVQPGTKVSGIICPQEDDGREVAYRTTEQTDPETGDVLKYDNGDVRLQADILLATDLRDWTLTSENYQDKVRDDDDARDVGLRRVLIKGSSASKGLKEALKKAHVKRPEIGGVLTVTFVRKDPVPNSKTFKQNVFEVSYQPPTDARAAEARRIVAEAEEPGGTSGAPAGGGAGDDAPPF